MTLKKGLYYGIEIEGIYNNEVLDIFCCNDGYNNENDYYNEDEDDEHPEMRLNTDIILKYWESASDGSLNGNGVFDDEITREYRSILLKNKTDFFNSIKEFKKFCKGDKLKLNEVIHFNQTCGCHIHIGFKDNRRFYKLASYEVLKKFRELFFKKVNESKNLSDITKKNIIKHYYRYYSRKLEKREYNKPNTPRRVEFNIQSEKNGKGLEWRSFNLNDVKSWDEFDTLFKICFECLEFLNKTVRNGYILENKTIRLQKLKIKEIIKAKIEKNNQILNNRMELLKCVI